MWADKQRRAKHVEDDFLAAQQQKQAAARGGRGLAPPKLTREQIGFGGPWQLRRRPSPVASPVAANAQVAQASARRGAISSPAASISASKISA